MGIALEKTDAKFRSLVAAGEAAAAAARVRRKYHLDVGGISPLVSQEPPRPLARRARPAWGRGARKESSGRCYRVEFTLHACQPLDWDNAAGSIKEAQDKLVEAGWLPDGDGWQELEGSAKAVKVAHKSEQKTVAILTRIK